MKIFVVLIILAVLVGCSNRALYEEPECNFDIYLPCTSPEIKNYDLKAHEDLGSIDANENLLHPNLLEAKKLYDLAIKGNHVAQYRLGRMYEVGRGVKYNLVEAKKWFRLSAAQDNRQALFELALMYQYGVSGVKKNKNKALALHKKGCEKGNTVSCDSYKKLVRGF